jgi:hypothetical protein
MAQWGLIPHSREQAPAPMQGFNMPVLQPDTLSLLRASRAGNHSVFDALSSRM